MIPMLLTTTPTLATKLQINLSYNLILKRFMRGGKLPSGKPSRPQIESPKTINNNSPENSNLNPAQNFNKLTEQEAKDAITNLDSKAMELHKDFSSQSLPSQQLQNSPAAVGHKKLSPDTPLSSEKITPNTLPGYHDLKSALFSSDNHTITTTLEKRSDKLSQAQVKEKLLFDRNNRKNSSTVLQEYYSDASNISANADATPIISNNDPINVSTSSVEPKKLINHLGVDYTEKTKINANTKVEDLTQDICNDELKLRGLIKDVEKEPVSVLNEKDVLIKIGDKANGVKLTKRGIAYKELIEKESPKIENDTTKFIPITDGETKIMISLPGPPSKDCVVSLGAHKHLIIIYNISTKEYYAIAYLTSKSKEENFLSDKKFKDFQVEKEKEANSTKISESTSITTNINEKEKKVLEKQYIFRFDAPLKIDEKDIDIVKYSDEYVESLPKESREDLEGLWEILKQKAYEDFSEDGLTAEECLQIILKYDDIIRSKGAKEEKKHPLNKEEIQINQENSENNKNIEEAKKQARLTQNEIEIGRASC